jgi:hypothetical protein
MIGASPSEMRARGEGLSKFRVWGCTAPGAKIRPRCYSTTSRKTRKPRSCNALSILRCRRLGQVSGVSARRTLGNEGSTGNVWGESVAKSMADGARVSHDN